MFMTNFQDNPIVIRIFNGIRPVVISLIAVPMINMARKNNRTWWAWLITVATLLAVALLKISPIYILIVVMVLAFAVTYYREKKEGLR